MTKENNLKTIAHYNQDFGVILNDKLIEVVNNDELIKEKSANGDPILDRVMKRFDRLEQRFDKLERKLDRCIILMRLMMRNMDKRVKRLEDRLL